MVKEILQTTLLELSLIGFSMGGYVARDLCSGLTRSRTERQRIRQLEDENWQLRSDVDILKKPRPALPRK